MKRFLSVAGFFYCLTALSSLSMAAVATPKVGFVRCRDGAVYQLYGLHANFVTGERFFSLGQAASFSDQGGLVASDGRLMLVGSDGTVQSTFFEGEASPVLNVDGAATSAIAWLPRQSELLVWSGTQFVGIPVALGGKVDSVRLASANSAVLLVTETNNMVVQVTVSLQGGVVTDITAIPGASGAAFYQQSFLLFRGSSGLEVQASNGSIRTLPITQTDLSFERIGTDWVHISSASAQRDWVVHLNAKVMELSELPQPKQSSPLSRPLPAPFYPRAPELSE